MNQPLFRASPTKVARSLELLANAAIEAQYQAINNSTNGRTNLAQTAATIEYLCMQRLNLLVRPLLIPHTARILRPSNARKSMTVQPFVEQVRGWKKQHKRLKFRR